MHEGFRAAGEHRISRTGEWLKVAHRIAKKRLTALFIGASDRTDSF